MTTEITPERARSWMLKVAFGALVLAFFLGCFGVYKWKTTPNHNLQINATKNLVCLDGLEYFTITTMPIDAKSVTYVTGVKYDVKTMQPETCSR